MTLPTLTLDDLDEAKMITITQYFNGDATISFFLRGEYFLVRKSQNPELFERVFLHAEDTRDIYWFCTRNYYGEPD